MDQVKLLPATTILLLLCLFCLLLQQSCCAPVVRGQNAATTRPTIRGRVTSTESASRNAIDGTSLACPDSYQQYYCLNRGKCFLVNTGISYEYNCECTSGFLGHRCQFKQATSFENPIHYPEKDYSDDND